MPYYARFFHMSTGFVEGSMPPEFSDDHKKPIEACGDQSIVVIDGRLSRDNAEAIAMDTGRKRGFIGYSLAKGKRLCDVVFSEKNMVRI